MKLSITAVFVVACALAFGQDVQAQDAKKEHKLTGCLLPGAANTYILGSREKRGPRLAVIVSSSTELASHVGHKVEITGTLVPAKEAEADPNVPKAFHYMNVTAAETISGSCQ
jgi:hypothetical protein